MAVQKSNVEYAHFTKDEYCVEYPRTVAWMINPMNNKQIIYATARCHKNDEFNKAKGRELAHTRLMNAFEFIATLKADDTKDYRMSGTIEFEEVYDFIKKNWRVDVIRFDKLFEDNVLNFDYISRFVIRMFFKHERWKG